MKSTLIILAYISIPIIVYNWIGPFVLSFYPDTFEGIRLARKHASTVFLITMFCCVAYINCAWDYYMKPDSFIARLFRKK